LRDQRKNIKTGRSPYRVLRLFTWEEKRKKRKKRGKEIEKYF
jgi:hypothetical protein